MEHPDYYDRMCDLEMSADAGQWCWVATRLKDALSDPKPLVRESAVYGIEGHLDDPAARSLLAKVVDEDTSPGVVEAAREALENWEAENESA